MRGTLRAWSTPQYASALGKAEPHIGQWLPSAPPFSPWRVAVVHQGRGPSWPLGEAGPQGLVAPAGPQGREGLQGPGPQGLIGERGGAGPPAHLAPSDRKARKARQGTSVGGTQWRTCPPGPQGAAGPPGPPGPERRHEFTPIFRVVTETETLAARGASFWPDLYARAAQTMEREGQAPQRLACACVSNRSPARWRVPLFSQPLTCQSNRNPLRSGTRKSR